MHCGSKVRCFYREFDCIFFIIPKSGRKYSRANSQNVAMTLTFRKMIIPQLELGPPVYVIDHKFHNSFPSGPSLWSMSAQVSPQQIL